MGEKLQLDLVSMVIISIKQFLPYPQDGDGTNYAKNKVGEIAFAKQLNVQQVADECTHIAANDTHDKVHAATFSFADHDTVGNVTNKDTSQYRPSCEICKMF